MMPVRNTVCICFPAQMQGLEVSKVETVQLSTSPTLQNKSWNSCYYRATDTLLPAYVIVPQTNFCSKCERIRYNCTYCWLNHLIRYQSAVCCKHSAHHVNKRMYSCTMMRGEALPTFWTVCGSSVNKYCQHKQYSTHSVICIQKPLMLPPTRESVSELMRSQCTVSPDHCSLKMQLKMSLDSHVHLVANL